MIRASALFLAALPSLWGGTFYFSGSLAHDDDLLRFEFTIGAPSLVTTQTWSYGGPTDPLSNNPIFGGFAPVLTVFDSLGNLAGGPDTGGVVGGNPPCGARGVDPVTNFCLDGYIQEVLSPGTYLLVLTEYDNLPLGTFLSDGYSRTGQGDFTGTAFGPGSGRFYDPFGNPRTGDYVLTIDGVDTAAQLGAVPEPSTMLLTLLGIAGAIGYGRRRAADRP
jgi:hypothetical protein